MPEFGEGFPVDLHRGIVQGPAHPKFEDFEVWTEVGYSLERFRVKAFGSREESKGCK